MGGDNLANAPFAVRRHQQAGAGRRPMMQWQEKIHGITQVPSGKHTKNYGKSPFLMGTSTINSHFK